MRKIKSIIVLLFLNSILASNLYVIIQKQNLDFIGLVTFIFLGSKIIQIVRLKKIFLKKTLSMLNLLLCDIFFLLLLINASINMTHLYSYELGAKIFRNIEYLQTLLFSLILIVPKLRFLKKIIPEFILLFLMIPPGSATIVSSYLLYPTTVVTIFSILIWLIFFKLRLLNICKIPLYSACIFPLLFFVWPFIGFFGSSWTFNLVDFNFSNFLSICSAMLLVLSIQNQKKIGQILILLLFALLSKFFMIGFNPSPLPSYAAVNNNLYAITIEFLFFVTLIYFFIHVRNEKKIYLILLPFLLLLLLVDVLNLKSQTALIAICFSSFVFGLIYLFKKYFRFRNQYVLVVILILFFIFVSCFLYYVFYLNTIESIAVRVEIWKLVFNGWTSSWSKFMFGSGDYGKINLLQYVYLNDNIKINELQKFGSDFFQMHIHNEFLSFGYGSGIFYLIYFLFLAFLPIYYLTKNFLKLSIYYAFGLVIFSYLIHGLTEPIVSTGITSCVFWFSYFMLVIKIIPKNIQLLKIKDIYFKCLNTFFILIVLYFSIGNLLNRKIIHIFFNYPYIQQLIRNLEVTNNPILLTDQELKKAINNSEIKNKLLPTSIYEFVKLADLYLYDFIKNKNVTSIDRAEELYCYSFEMLSVPGFYNNLQNIRRIKNINKNMICSKNQNSHKQFYHYDRYNLILPNVY